MAAALLAALSVGVAGLVTAPAASAGPFVGDPNAYEPDSMAVGAGPKGVTVVGNLGATANFNENSITVFEPCSPKSCYPRVVATLPVGKQPSDVAISSSNSVAGRVFVTNSGDSSISVVDYNYNANPMFQPALPVLVGGEPTGIALTKDGARAYIADKAANALLYFDTSSLKVTDIVPVAAGPWGVVLSPDGTRAYVAGNSGNAVSVVDTAAHHVVATIPVGHAPGGIALDGTGQSLVVPNNADGTISIIDTDSNAVVGTARVGLQPWGAAINRGYAYVANYGSSSISVVDLETQKTIATVSTGGSPFGVASNDPYTMLATNSGSNLIQVIDLAMTPFEVDWSSSAKTRKVTGRLPLDGAVTYSIVATRGAKHRSGTCRVTSDGTSIACTVTLTKGTWRVSVKTKLPWQPKPYGQQNKKFVF